MGEAVGTEMQVRASDYERLAEIRQILEAGMQYRETNRESTWRQSEDQYIGRHWDNVAVDDPTADLTTVNLSFSTVNTIVPFVTNEEPRFLVTPYSRDATVENARLQQAWLNKLWRKQSTGAHEALETSVTDYLIYGDGYGKVSYGLVDKMKDGSDIGSATVADIFVDAISPWDLWIDPMADGLHNARWVCHRIYSTKDEILADERYEDVKEDQLVSGSLDALDETRRGDRAIASQQDVQDWVKLYEFYDHVHEEMWTFTDFGDKPLRVVEGIKMAPIVQMGNYRLPHSPYHMGELEQLWPMQQELNKSRSQLITHRRRNAAKYLIREDAITDGTEGALASPIVGEIVPIKGDAPLDSIVKPAQLAALPSESYGSADQAERDIYEISGVNEYLRGAAPEIRRTATEASIIEGASNVKTRAKLAAVERAVRKLGTLIIETAKDIYPETDVDEMAMFLTGHEAEVIARNDAGREADQLASRGDILGAEAAMREGGMSDIVMTPTEEIFIGVYEVEVESGSTEMRSPQAKEQKFRDMASALVGMSEALSMAGVQLNLRKVFELWFEAAGITDIDGMFADPMMQQVGMGLPAMPPQGPPMGGPPMAGPTPDDLAMLLGGQPGTPNAATAQPPMELLSDVNTGALPPA